MKLLKFNEAKLNFGTFETEKYGKYHSIQWLNQKILAYIDEVYKPFGFSYKSPNKDILVDGKLINTEYIGKMVNNYTVFRNIIRLNRITTEAGFYDYMTNNFDKIYHYNGIFFKEVLQILINTSKAGNIGEQKAFNFFEETLLEKGYNIRIDSPTLEEDIKGIDGKFNWNGKTITIQVKPYEKATISSISGMVKAYSQGSLSLGTDYLVLYGDKIIIVKAKDVVIDGNNFIFDEFKIVAIKK
jgi:hypothetical protein